MHVSLVHGVDIILIKFDATVERAYAYAVIKKGAVAAISLVHVVAVCDELS